LPTRPSVPVLAGLLLETGAQGLVLSSFDYARQGWRTEISRARMWLRPGGLVTTPGLTVQLEAGW
jgi:hypothetical protein